MDTYIPNNYVPVDANLYDCFIKCDSSTKVCFNGLEQTDVLRLLQLCRNAIVFKDYSDPQTTNVSLVVSAHVKENGDS